MSELDALDNAFARFADEWRRLPPLVRAGAAQSLLWQSKERIDGDRRAIEVLQAAGLERRVRVLAAFIHSAEIFGELAIQLAKHADDEAQRRGIDADLDGRTPT